MVRYGKYGKYGKYGEYGKYGKYGKCAMYGKYRSYDVHARLLVKKREGVVLNDIDSSLRLLPPFLRDKGEGRPEHPRYARRPVVKRHRSHADL